MKITHNVTLNFHPIIIPFNQLFWTILNFGLRPGGIADLSYRFALSLFFKLIRRRTLQPNSKIRNPNRSAK